MENIKSSPATGSGLKRRQGEEDGENPKKQVVKTSSSNSLPLKLEQIKAQRETKANAASKEEEREKAIRELLAGDKKDIETQLQSKSSILILELSANNSAHCRARHCFPGKLREHPRIESEYRLRLDHLVSLNRYYHVSCMEQLFDLSTLIEPTHLPMKGGAYLTRSDHALVRLHPAIENGGRSDVVDGLAREMVHGNWEDQPDTRFRNYEFHEVHGKLECEPEESNRKDSIHNWQNRAPRLLSEVLASICKVPHINGIPQELWQCLAGCKEDKGGDATRLKQLVAKEPRNPSSRDP
ncbi:hypothetical protein BDZ45DRAFT_397190 [Acephala macrosclerotiorum]|nr:hypothetical protein BDZ45DRAFT_397190 [Acephala macrosclerotiorum]